MKIVQSRQKLWQNLSAEANRITDNLGKKIDAGIKELVIALWANDFKTAGSCEGHLNWGIKTPWVDMGSNPTEEELKELKNNSLPISELFTKYPNLNKVRKKNLKIQKQLLDLLSKYYSKHYVLEDERFVLEKIGIFGTFRIINQGFEIQEINSEAEQKARLIKYQKEANFLAKFLKKKLFSS